MCKVYSKLHGNFCYKKHISIVQCSAVKTKSHVQLRPTVWVDQCVPCTSTMGCNADKNKGYHDVVIVIQVLPSYYISFATHCRAMFKPMSIMYKHIRWVFFFGCVDQRFNCSRFVRGLLVCHQFTVKGKGCYDQAWSSQLHSILLQTIE